MKLIITFTITLISMSTMGQSLPYKALLKIYYNNEFPVIYPNDEKLESAVLLDSREKDEFEVSHIHGAKWVGFESFNMEKVSGFSKDKPIVIYCSIGIRSQKIGIQLKEAGFKEVYNLYGGIFHWVNEGKPVYKAGIKTSKVHAFSPLWGIWLKKGEKVYTP